jgi:hypothetical protein
VGVILTGSVPNLVQRFNLYLYATFAPYFRTEFFDSDSPDSLIYVYALFALTFVVRPLGSWLSADSPTREAGNGQSLRRSRRCRPDPSFSRLPRPSVRSGRGRP